MLKVTDLTKKYKSGEHQLTVLDHVSFEVIKGSSCGIVGPSGSGKTTLLGLSAGLDRADEGNVFIGDQLLNTMDEEALARFRNKHIGFVFQNFQLIPTLTALENVMVPAELLGVKNIHNDAVELLSKVGLESRITHYPNQLSGGEQQRVALARAFITKPEILFADEPTGNLDIENSEMVEKLMFELNEQNGTTLVIVTHDNELAAKCDMVVNLKGGKVDQINHKPNTVEV